MWRNVTRPTPCPICRRPDWCSFSTELELVACRRLPSDRERSDRNGARFWLHRLRDCAVVLRETETRLPAAGAPRACIDVLHAVYSALLAALSLSPAHRDNLRQRGLPDREIDRRGYRTLPSRGRGRLAKRLLHQFGADVCSGVPGLFLHEESDTPWWSVAGTSGLVIPARDISGRIQGLRLRSDDPEGARYSWMSSRKHGGPTPGACVHVPLYSGQFDVVRLTEGELKADVSTVLAGTLTISVPGVTNYPLALAVLEALQVRRALLAFDADARYKPTVARALAGAMAALQANGFEVAMECWSERYV
jgi:DNA primase